MRISAGHARGMVLKAPKDLRIRPMPERMKKAVFSSLGEAVMDARVLDLFAGTGSLGIETMSRGAAHVVFVDSSAEAMCLIEGNLALAARAFKTESRFDIIRADVFAWLKRNEGGVEPFDLILADPPYPKGHEESIAWKLLQEEALPPMLRANGWLVLGHSKRDPVKPGASWELGRRLAHGDCIASFFRRKMA